MSVQEHKVYLVAPVQPSLRIPRVTELTVINLLGGIPRPLGNLLRRITYRLLFAKMGRGVDIQTGVELIGANSIEVGDEVKILWHTRLEIKHANCLLRIGNRVCLDRGVDIKASSSDCLIEIGDDSYLGPYVCMAGPGHIKIGKECLIASHSSLYANNHRAYGVSREGIEIQDNCWLGTGVRVLDGVTIGKGCVIGAGAVVTKNIPPYSVAVGVPAKVIGASKGGVV
ncbi:MULTISPECIES: acyltransferase [Nostocales]|uniref:Acyltransferase n=3 Tax=Nostocales TaxID=1161 RepID=A0A8S9SXG2_9CYAN|nr:acyltransferase [Tolypothrix bouteillei]KAF3884427.1 acyltransferase [Tolypothrix bouteillei VB521301]